MILPEEKLTLFLSGERAAKNILYSKYSLNKELILEIFSINVLLQFFVVILSLKLLQHFNKFLFIWNFKSPFQYSSVMTWLFVFQRSFSHQRCQRSTRPKPIKKETLYKLIEKHLPTDEDQQQNALKHHEDDRR